MNVELQSQVLRERISKLEAQVRFLYKHLNVTYVPGADFDLDPRDQATADFLKKGDELGAIKSYRATHGVDVAEAKAAVDEIRSGLGL